MSAEGALELAKAYVSVRGDSSKLAGDLKAQLPTVEAAMEGFVGKIEGILAKIGVAVGIFELIDKFREGAEAAHEFEVAAVKLDLMMKNMGDSIGITSSQLQEWINANTIGGTTSKKAMMEAATGLTMYSNVQGQVFLKALSTANDLAVVTGSLSQASNILGRALQDPEHGLMLLRRAHISLTQEQKNTIINFARQGELVKAQGAILDAVSSKVHGLSDAYDESDPGKLDAARKQLAIIQEKMGAMWLPVEESLVRFQTKFYEVVTSFAKWLSPIIKAMSDWIGKHKELVEVLLTVIGAIVLLKTVLVTVTAVMKAFAVAEAFAMAFSGPIGWLAVTVALAATGLAILAINNALGETATSAANAQAGIGKVATELEHKQAMEEYNSAAKAKRIADDREKKYLEQHGSIAQYTYAEGRELHSKKEAAQERFDKASEAAAKSNYTEPTSNIKAGGGELTPKNEMGTRIAFPDFGKKIQDILLKDAQNGIEAKQLSVLEQIRDTNQKMAGQAPVAVGLPQG